MLAPTPPRRTSRSSTRNDTDSALSFSGISASEKRPENVIRWSVATEPVTAIRPTAQAVVGRAHVTAVVHDHSSLSLVPSNALTLSAAVAVRGLGSGHETTTSSRFIVTVVLRSDPICTWLTCVVVQGHEPTSMPPTRTDTLSDAPWS